MLFIRLTSANLLTYEYYISLLNQNCRICVRFTKCWWFLGYSFHICVVVAADKWFNFTVSDETDREYYVYSFAYAHQYGTQIRCWICANRLLISIELWNKGLLFVKKKRIINSFDRGNSLPKTQSPYLT